MERITSRQNPLVARFREAARHPGPDRPLLLDGPHLVEAALTAGLAIETAAAVASRASGPPPAVTGLLDRLTRSGARLVTVSEAVLGAMSPVRTPSGIVALAARPAQARDRMLQPQPALLVVALGVQDPGNLGAVIRAAEAGGATGVVCAAATADPFGWKALRGSMGSALRLPVWSVVRLEELGTFLRERGVRMVAAVPRDGNVMYDVDLTCPTALLVGAEGQGLPPDAESWADTQIRIPMRPETDSLNVAVAAALLVYEERRQRQARAGTHRAG